MQITFSSSIDSGYYLDYSLEENKNIFNKSYLGPSGLLGMLERELGLTGDYSTSQIRKIKYQAILKDFAQNGPEAFFAKSFAQDPAGVAGELLRYRDQLVLAGWDKNKKGISVKIDTLASIETKSDVSAGREDRWRKVLEQLKTITDGGLSVSELVMTESIGDLHPFFRELFEILKTKGVQIKDHHQQTHLQTHQQDPKQEHTQAHQQDYQQTQLKQQQTERDQNNNLNTLKNWLGSNTRQKLKLNPDDKKSFQILNFPNELEAHEFIASQPLSDISMFPGETVILNRNNHVFDLVQQTFGKSASGSVIRNARPQLLQIIPLSLSLFIKPVNIYNLISYLQVSIHPLPLKLRNKLLKIIAKNGGIPREKWDEAVNLLKKEDAQQAKDKMIFARLQNNDPSGIPIQNLLVFYNSLSDWSRRRQHSIASSKEGHAPSDEIAFAELNELRSACKAIVQSLEIIPGETITQKELEVIINEVAEEPDITILKPQVSSVLVFSSPGQLISDTATLIWLDFYNCDIKPDYYSFLTEEERSRLGDQDVILWDNEAQARSKMNEFRKAITKTSRRLILVFSEKVNDETASQHPLFSLLNSSIDNLKEFIIRPSHSRSTDILDEYEFQIPAVYEVNQRKFHEKKSHYHVENLNLVQLREKESYSSIDKLIHYPFDWLLEYGLHLKPGRIVEPDDIFTIKGNVSHKLAEKLIALSEKDISKAKAILNSEYEKILADITESHGALLLLEQNHLEYTLFKARLKPAINTLFDLIINNNLKVIDTEYKADGRLKKLGDRFFSAYIDLLLEDPKGSKIVVDMKFSRKDTRYREMIKEGKAIQLALYSAILESNGYDVSKTAYYSLSESRLISASEFKGEDLVHIKEAPPNETVLERTANSLAYRLNQLSKGILEEGEEMLLEELDYFKDQAENILIPLDNKDKKKKKNFYSHFEILKGTPSKTS